VAKTDILTEEEAQHLLADKAHASQGLVKLTDLDIQLTSDTIQQAEKLVSTVLEPDIDWGLHPGTNSMALKDSGGSKIANAFNTYPEHTILHLAENDDLISYLVQAKLIHRGSGKIVASGVGACSTMESKYAYRWVTNPEEFGFDKASVKYDKKKGKYRIPNPEIEDLGNTILKMASKRAEIDAANSLPGVGSGLKKLFGKKDNRNKEVGDRWMAFWTQVGALGLDEERVHSLLNVKSMKDWLSSGKSLNEAVEVLAKTVAAESKAHNQKRGGNQGEEELPQVDEKLLNGWQIARKIMQDLEVTDKQIRNWFSHYKLEVGLADFAKALPREDITADIISNFVAMLDAYKEKKAAEKSQDILD
jgi:hypothetical protein